jgi:acetyl-CoA acetyltransferase
MPEEQYFTGPSTACAARLYADAGCAPDDIASAQFYDHFSPMVLLQLEAFGFCGRGQAAAFVADGQLDWARGRLPTNTSGGHLSEAYLHGLNLAVEAVRQVRGTSSAQVARDGPALVASGGSGMVLAGRG